MSYSEKSQNVFSNAPVVNPYEQFTQREFDEFIGGLTHKIQGALHPHRRSDNSSARGSLSFESGLGEFSFGRNFSSSRGVSLATDVPPSAEEHESGAKSESDEEDKVDKKELILNGLGDEESPFVISDDDEEIEPGEGGTPKAETTKPQVTRQQAGSPEWDEEVDEGFESDEKEKREPEVIELLEDDDEEQDQEDELQEDEAQEYSSFFKSPLEGPSEHVGEEYEQDSREQSHHLDEYFTADVDHIPSDLHPSHESQARLEIQEVGNMPLRDSYAQDRPVSSDWSLKPTEDSQVWTRPSQVDEMAYHESNPPAPSPWGFDTSEERERDYTQDTRALSFHSPSFNGASTSLHPSSGAMHNTQEHETIQTGGNEIFSLYNEGPWPPAFDGSFISPQAVLHSSDRIIVDETPREQVPPSLSLHYNFSAEQQDAATSATPNHTPPLSPSGRTITAPDPSLISYNSSIATNVPIIESVSHRQALPTRLPLDEVLLAQPVTETADVDDRSLPTEVTAELRGELPDPHRVPEPTDLGIPEGIAGLASHTQVTEPSILAEPPTPFVNSEGAASGDDRSERVAETGEPAGEEPPVDEPIVEELEEEPELPNVAQIIGNILPAPVSSQEHVRAVHWEDDVPAATIPMSTLTEELKDPETVLMQPTPTENVESSKEEKISLTQMTMREDEVPLPVELSQDVLGDHDSEGSSQGILTRNSTWTEATLSQRRGSITMQPGSSTASEVPVHAVELLSTQATIDEGPHGGGTDVKSDAGPRSSSSFDDSSLSDLSKGPSVISPKRGKRKRIGPRLTTHVGSRELHALQDGAVQVHGPRHRKKASAQSSPTISTTGPNRKGRKGSPVMKSTMPAPSRRRGLRKSPQLSVAKEGSPVSSTDKAATITDEERDELDILAEVNEEDDHDGRSTVGSSPYRGGKGKRKRHARASKAGDDADYLPEEEERSVKKRKLDTKEMGPSLETADLSGLFDTPEADKVAELSKVVKEKRKNKKKGKAELLDAMDAESSGSPSSDDDSDFRPSPEPEPKSLNEGTDRNPDETTTQMPTPTRPNSKTGHYRTLHKLDLASRAYVPPVESDSDTDDEPVIYADLLKDVEGVVEGIAERNKGLQPEAAGEEKGKKKKKSTGSSGKRSKKGSGISPSTRTESQQGMEIDRPTVTDDTALQRDETLRSALSSEPTNHRPPDQPSAASVIAVPSPDIGSKPTPTGWGGFLRNLWSSGARTGSRASSDNRMDVD